MKTRIGLYNENFQMDSQEILEAKTEDVNGIESKFNITAGPLIFRGKPLKETYVLEIHYRDSEEEHRKTLFLEGFGSNLPSDYAHKVHELADKFCKERNLVINNHINSWPEYQAIVSKKPKKESKRLFFELFRKLGVLN